MKKNDKYEFAEIFRKQLKNLIEKEEIGSLYNSLFELLSDDSLNEELEYLFSLFKGKDDYFKKNGKTDWFYIWHKSIRQTDYFQNLVGYKIENILTDEQEKELVVLKKQMNLIRDKVVFPLKRDATEEEYKKHEDSYKALNSMDEYKVLLKRNKELIALKRHQSEIRLGGIMDSMLWNTIRLDKKNSLYETFLRTFSEMEIQEKMNALNAKEKV